MKRRSLDTVSISISDGDGAYGNDEIVPCKHLVFNGKYAGLDTTDAILHMSFRVPGKEYYGRRMSIALNNTDDDISFTWNNFPGGEVAFELEVGTATTGIITLDASVNDY